MSSFYIHYINFIGGVILNKKLTCTILVLTLILSSMGFAFADSTYVVKSGDKLWKIAQKYDTTWQDLAKYNKLADPNLIFPNQKISIPSSTPTAQSGTAATPAPVTPAAPTPVITETASTKAMKAAIGKETDSYLAKADANYAYNIAYELSTNPKYHDSALGTRTAGSDAEHAAADYLLSTMKDIGLSDTEKVGTNVDKWQFNSSTLQIAGDSKVILPHSYATASTPASGITSEIVYLGKGTEADYAKYKADGGDITGKIVLVDIDMRADWWITYPMLEAQHQGAAAIMNSCVSGFSEISKDAYNCNDICGPTAIPCVNITQTDAEYVKAQLAKGAVTATLKVDNDVEENGTSYNVIGKIKGKSSAQQIIVGGHYDAYFQGFQDDCCAVGLVLAMAKAMKDSGYVPENDIVFCIHGSEEWGASYTQYDWCTGSWNMINKVHPEWAGKTLAFINFELPAYEFASYTNVCSAPELYSMIKTFVNDGYAPKPVGCFPDGVLTDGYPTYTYSDDFSYCAAGVPSTVNGFLREKDGETVFPFYYKYYHTNFDTYKIYNANVMKFNLQFYGAMAIFVDQVPAMQLDFTSQVDRLSAAADDSIMTAAGADVTAYKAAIAKLSTAAAASKKAIDDVNTRYYEAVANGADQTSLDKIRSEAQALNKKNLATFKYVQDQFLGLMYEKPIVPHEAAQSNIALIQDTIAALEKGDVAGAVDNYAYDINNVFEWYAMYFSPEVMKTHYAMFYSKDNQNNLFWGTNRNFVPADVETATRSLMARYDETGGDFTAEINIYKAAITAQQKVLKTSVTAETDAILKLADML